ncbi:MAG: hypothetical protein VX694_16245 [Planctomycetota bacterium]|nr:hypothetical protein [Planctomycetota bacterium]
MKSLVTVCDKRPVAYGKRYEAVRLLGDDGLEWLFIPPEIVILVPINQRR